MVVFGADTAFRLELVALALSRLAFAAMCQLNLRSLGIHTSYVCSSVRVAQPTLEGSHVVVIDEGASRLRINQT
jgi:hypothetical protein